MWSHLKQPNLVILKGWNAFSLYLTVAQFKRHDRNKWRSNVTSCHVHIHHVRKNVLAWHFTSENMYLRMAFLFKKVLLPINSYMSCQFLHFFLSSTSWRDSCSVYEKYLSMSSAALLPNYCFVQWVLRRRHFEVVVSEDGQMLFTVISVDST